MATRPRRCSTSAALGTDLQSAALQVGKALNDPRQGVTALSRAGIQFSDVQKANIRQMVEMGDVAGAQGVILKELEVQFGGIAEAMATTPTGQWTVAMNALGDALEQIGQIITPYITQLAAAIREAALAFQALPESARTTIVVIGGLVAVLGPILVSIGFMVQGLGALATGFVGVMSVAASFTGVLMSLAGGWSMVLAAIRAILALVGGMLSWPVAVGAAFGVLAVTVALHWDEIVATVADALTALEDAAQSAMESVKDWFGSAFDWIAGSHQGTHAEHLLGRLERRGRPCARFSRRRPGPWAGHRHQRQHPGAAEPRRVRGARPRGAALRRRALRAAERHAPGPNDDPGLRRRRAGRADACRDRRWRGARDAEPDDRR